MAKIKPKISRKAKAAKNYTDGQDVQIRLPDGSIETVNTASPLYAQMYGANQIQSTPGTEAEPINLQEVTVRPPKGFWEQSYDKFQQDNKDSEFIGAMLSPFTYALSVPQQAMMYGATGKVQDPSEALGIENPYAAFAANAIIDPSNIVGAGLASKGRVLPFLNNLVNPFAGMNFRKGAKQIPGSGNALENYYKKGLMQLMPEKKYFTGELKHHALKEIKKASLAFSPNTTKALGRLDPAIAEQMLSDYRYGNYPSVEAFRKNVKKAILESERLKKIHPSVDFGKEANTEYKWALKKPETLKQYADIQLMTDKSNASQKSFIDYLGKDYAKKMDLINQNAVFRNIANESPQYTDLIYEHLKNPNISDDEFVTNLVKQSNTFTRALHEPSAPEEFFTLQGKSLSEGTNNTMDLEGFPVSGDYGNFRYKIEPNAERMSEIAATPIEQRWEKRFPETFNNENINLKEGWLFPESEAYKNWRIKRLERNRNVNNVPNIRYPKSGIVPTKYILYPQHKIFSSELDNQVLKGFDLSKIDIENPRQYIPGFTRGFSTGGVIPPAAIIGAAAMQEKKNGGSVSDWEIIDNDLPIMQGGGKGSRPPIYVDNPNDPRLRAYQDSSRLYNKEKALYERETKLSYDKLLKSPHSNIPGEPGYGYTFSGKPLYGYKKPVQPVKFKAAPPDTLFLPQYSKMVQGKRMPITEEEYKSKNNLQTINKQKLQAPPGKVIKIKQSGGDIPVDPMGYLNPNNYDKPAVIIPSNEITMKKKNGKPLKKGRLLGIDDTGYAQMMYPGEDYTFPGDYVTEYPLPEAGGGYRVIRSNERKGKTHKVIGPDGTVKFFGDSKLGQHPKDPARKKAFYARHKKNLAKNPYFRAFARKTWAEGGELDFAQEGIKTGKFEPKKGVQYTASENDPNYIKYKNYEALKERDERIKNAYNNFWKDFQNYGDVENFLKKGQGIEMWGKGLDKWDPNTPYPSIEDFKNMQGIDPIVGTILSLTTGGRNPSRTVLNYNFPNEELKNQYYSIIKPFDKELQSIDAEASKKLGFDLNSIHNGVVMENVGTDGVTRLVPSEKFKDVLPEGDWETYCPACQSGSHFRNIEKSVKAPKEVGLLPLAPGSYYTRERQPSERFSALYDSEGNKYSAVDYFLKNAAPHEKRKMFTLDPVTGKIAFKNPETGEEEFKFGGMLPDLAAMAAGGQFLTVGGEYHRIYKNADGDIMVNHPKEDKGKWDTINLTNKAGAKTVADGVAATKKWHRENPYAFGGLPMALEGRSTRKNVTRVPFPQNQRDYMMSVGANPKYRNLDSSEILRLYSQDQSTWPKTLDITEEICSEPGKCGPSSTYKVSPTMSSNFQPSPFLKNLQPQTEKAPQIVKNKPIINPVVPNVITPLPLPQDTLNVSKYSRMVNGKRIPITKEEYDKINAGSTKTGSGKVNPQGKVIKVVEKKAFGGLHKAQDGFYNMQRALDLGYNPDDQGHWPSVDSETGMWLKSKEHPTAWMEYLYGYTLNPEVQKNFKHPVVNPEGYFGENQLQYIPKQAFGGNLILEKYKGGGSVWEIIE